MKLHSLTFGQGLKDLIVLHGFLGMSDNWKSLAKEWSKIGFKVHLIDQRNHGRSFWSDEFNYDVLAKDLFIYMRDLKISSSIILGHSMGGKVAMNFALNYESMVSKLLVIDISPKKYINNNQDILDGLSSLDFNLIKSRKEADKHLQSYVSETSVRNFLLKNIYWKTPNRLALRMNINVLKKNQDVYNSITSNNSFYNSTLFISGEMSNYINNDDEGKIMSLFPRAEIRRIKKAGHWVHVENKKDFLLNVEEFLKL